MNLTKGNLFETISSSDVMLLHALLRQMGREIAGTETGCSYFGPATKQAVSNLQQEFGLPPKGAVDPATATKINPTTYIAAKLNADTRPLDNKAVIYQVLTNVTFNLSITNIEKWVTDNRMASYSTVGLWVEA